MLNKIKNIIALVLLIAIMSTSLKFPAYAQAAGNILPWIPKPGIMLHLSPSFAPSELAGLTIHPNNALEFDFLVHRGVESLSQIQKKQEYTKLVKYFLASLTIPDQDQWVNLSPYEKNRIIKDDFGLTEMGRDLLSQDYILKEITSSLIYPESSLGKKFWDKVYTDAWNKYHTSRIPVNTFNKVWIVPDEAAVYESGNTVYILRNHLKVLLEEDYVSLQNHKLYSSKTTHSIGAQVIRQIILPELQREINEGKNFANLRQIYSGMILATWYKHALKESLLGKIYANKSKINGVNPKFSLRPQKNNLSGSNASGGDPEYIYQQYLKAFKKGVFNYIKEDVNRYTHEVISRKYFSGGAKGFENVIPAMTGRTSGFSQAMVVIFKNNDIFSKAMAAKIDYASIARNDIDRVDVVLNTSADSLLVSKPGLPIKSKEKLNPAMTGKTSRRNFLRITTVGVLSTLLSRKVYGANSLVSSIPTDQMSGVNADTWLQAILDQKINPQGHIIAVNPLINPKQQLIGNILAVPKDVNPVEYFSDTHLKVVENLAEAIAKDLRRQVGQGLTSGNFGVSAFRIQEALPLRLAQYETLITAANPETLSKWAELDPDNLLAAIKEKETQIELEIQKRMDEKDLLRWQADGGRNAAMVTLLDKIKVIFSSMFNELNIPGQEIEKFKKVENFEQFSTLLERLRISYAIPNDIINLYYLVISNSASQRDISFVDTLYSTLTVSKDMQFSYEDLKYEIIRAINAKQLTSNGLSSSKEDDWNKLHILFQLLPLKRSDSVQGLPQNVLYVNKDGIIEEEKAFVELKHFDKDLNGFLIGARMQDGNIHNVYVLFAPDAAMAVQRGKLRKNNADFAMAQAMLPLDKVSKDSFGGIDFNSANMNLLIKRDGSGVPLPLNQQNMAQLSRINGFVPEILGIISESNPAIIEEIRLKLQSFR